MKIYTARSDSAEYNLGNTEQMDSLLSKGASIYAYENGEYTLIATPEKGYLIDKPIFPVKETTEVSNERK